MIERKILTASHPALRSEADRVDVKDDGMFDGYGATTGNVDLGNDVIVQGAFDMPDGTDYSLLDHHKQDAPLGLFTVRKDSTGLRVKGQLNLEVQRAREVRALMKQGALTGLSIGYQVKDSYKQGGIRYLTKLELLEVSVVTFPMNPKARITGVKAAAREAAEAREIAALSELIRDMREYAEKLNRDRRRAA
jgi:Escherichia/Staphylococcus phage prohead protease